MVEGGLPFGTVALGIGPTDSIGVTSPRDDSWSVDALASDDRRRVVDALRYVGRDLHHRSFSVTSERRELLWNEMDACLQLAERLSSSSDSLASLEQFSDPAACPCTLITGASSGIGAALAHSFAQRSGVLVLVARRQERLDQLAAGLEQRFGIRVVAMALDLSGPRAVEQLLARVAAHGLWVETLVNNAGFGLRGTFEASPWLQLEAMLQLMVQVPTELTRHLLPEMQRRQRGTVLNVASLAGLIPGLPGSTLYSAVKAYLIRLSQSLAAENAGSGVRVMALCPGYVHTEFHSVLGVEERMQRLPGVFWMTVDQLVQLTERGLQDQRVVVVPGRLNRLIAAVAQYLPLPWANALSASFSRRFRSRP